MPFAVNPSTPAPSEPRVRTLRVFAHTNADKAEIYRQVLRCFVAAKERFALHLRPAEVRADATGPVGTVTVMDDELDRVLQSLVEWGNLQADADTAEVATVEDFRKRRLLYRLTREGEAAERALEVFERYVREPGELQSAGLDDVKALLAELEALLSAHASEGAPLDAAKASRILGALRKRFEDLTERAQAFMAGLMRAIDLHELEEDVFLAYKEKLIDYLRGFVNKLMVTTPPIGDATARLQTGGLDAALLAVARREASDRLDHSPELERELHELWRARWDGLRGWFVDRPGQPAQATVLRQRALAAIPAMLRAVENLHDRRVQRSDRRTDLLTLARWFAQTPRDADTHRLFRAAFGLCPARHLTVNEETLDVWEEEGVSVRHSWLVAPPVKIAPRLRQTGRHMRPGRTRKVVDRTAERELLREFSEREAAQLGRARERLGSLGTTRLSDVGELGRAEFELLLDLLGEALAQQRSPDDSVEATSADGSMRIVLAPILGAPRVSIRTQDGVLSGVDCVVTFEDLVAPQLRESEAAQ